MNENEVRQAIAKTADAIGYTEAEALARFEDICSKNNVNVSEEPMLALNLWKEFYNNALRAQKNTTTANTSGSSGGWYKTAFGYFVSVDDARDMLAMQNERIVADYRRDRDGTYNLGQVAVFTPTDDGKYEARMVREGEELMKVMVSLPANNVDMEDGTFVVPLDTNDAEWNKARYGKPLPASEWRRSAVFIGEVEGNMGKYYFNYKGPSCKEFNPKTFEWVHFECIINSSDDTKIHGGKAHTLGSLAYNSELADDDSRKKDMSSVDMRESLMEYSGDNFFAVVDLELAHNELQNKTNYNDRYIFTDGQVTTVNMNPTKNGNRLFHMSDYNLENVADFSWDDSITCWTPPHIEIDFGTGSNVVVVGRTSQGTDEDGNLRPISINVTGILVTKARGGSPEEITHIDENDDDFDDDWMPV